MGTGRTVGTVGGAALGTAIMPGVGTGLGGALGGAVGGLFDGGGSAPQITEVGYGGRTSTAGREFAAQEAARVADQGIYRDRRSTDRGINLQDIDYNAGREALARSQALGGAAQARGQMLGNTAQQMAFGGQQDAAYNQQRSQNLQNAGFVAGNQAGAMANQDRASQLDALGRLRGFYEQGPGPSAAEAQMRQGADANMAQAIALAHSGRGSGANANAMRSAAFQNAAAGQQMNQQLGVLRANEAANWRGQQLNAMGLEQNAFGGLRGQDIGQQGQLHNYALGAGQLGANYQQIGNQAQGTFEGQGLQGQLGFEGMGNQTNLGFANAGNQVGLGYSQLGNNQYQFGEVMRNKIYGEQSALMNQAQIANQNATTGNAATQQRADAADQAMLGSVFGTGVGMMPGSGGRPNASNSGGYGPTYGDGYRT